MIAASAADPTKTVSANVSLSPLTMSISPSSANLNAGQSQQFSAQVNHNTNTSVTWSINPAVGAISASGLYTAPAILGSQRSITVAATSVADPTKSLSSTVTLLSPVSVSPSAVSLSVAQMQQFTATVTGMGNTSVTWSISPSVGNISASGLYTAPASIASAQTVTVIATRWETRPAGVFNSYPGPAGSGDHVANNGDAHRLPDAAIHGQRHGIDQYGGDVEPCGRGLNQFRRPLRRAFQHYGADRSDGHGDQRCGYYQERVRHDHGESDRRGDRVAGVCHAYTIADPAIHRDGDGIGQHGGDVGRHGRRID